MQENFKPRQVVSKKAKSQTGQIIDLTVFSEYRPDETDKKIKNIWAYDLLRIEPDNLVIKFSGGESFTHPETKEMFTIIDGCKNI